MPDTSQNFPSLEVNKLSLARGTATLGPLSFTLPHAGCWWLSGVSGAGKSMLLETLGGFHGEAQGSIRVSDREVGHCAPEHRSISLMPQRWRLFPHWSVLRNLRFAAKLSGSGSSRIEQLAQRLQVSQLLDRPTRALSGGETQRIALIQTILSPARALLFDEPLSAVDAALQSVVLELIHEEAAQNHRICLVAAHREMAGYPMQGGFRIEMGQLVSQSDKLARSNQNERDGVAHRGINLT